MSYYFSKTVEVPLSQAVEKEIDALKSRGFGILTRIDVQSVLKEKIGTDPMTPPSSASLMGLFMGAHVGVQPGSIK